MTENEWVIYKPRWGAFFKTPLEEFLIRKGINTLIFTGCNFPNCPRTSIYEASERDFNVIMVKDAISGTYDRGNREINQIGARVLSANQLLRELRKLAH